MIFSFLGAYDPAYPRNAILRHGLEQNGAQVRECRLSKSLKFWMRYPIGLARCVRTVRRGDVIFVPEFCHKDVPLGTILSSFSARPLVFDPLAGRYETKIVDWRRRKPGTVRAWWNRAIDRISFGLSDLILADTQAHKDYFCRTYGLPDDKVAVVPVGYDDRLFRPERRAVRGAAKPAREFTVLFFGSFLPLHGVESIVEAAAMLARKAPSVRFQFVGSGQTLDRARIRADCLALGNVSFDGWLEMDELPARIAAADVCLGIFGETEKARRVVPHKVFQSLGMGKPVITARTPAAGEFFHHQRDIFFCDPPYGRSLAAAILDLKANAGLRRGLAEKGHDLVSRRYSPRALGRMLLDALAERDLGEPGGRR
jgi:glycosyltransferase involved in cell wall biosynthesis